MFMQKLMEKNKILTGNWSSKLTSLVREIETRAWLFWFSLISKKCRRQNYVNFTDFIFYFFILFLQVKLHWNIPIYLCNLGN
ncbi:hypothetical protein Patl1_22656 [Pistacia atlantica]|uniref:Uncharacterized protein n=1 Tax=Pistacia atlantica TaxID=434234 RepID=A0ACC0ZYB9_9ROSI|nr:hypothetical protein Patl1_22656 [Pistacia atlantica]